jgi:hypothetical protein
MRLINTWLELHFNRENLLLVAVYEAVTQFDIPFWGVLGIYLVPYFHYAQKFYFII